MKCESAALNKPDELFNQHAISNRDFSRFQQLIYDLAGITLGNMIYV